MKGRVVEVRQNVPCGVCRRPVRLTRVAKPVHATCRRFLRPAEAPLVWTHPLESPHVLAARDALPSEQRDAFMALVGDYADAAARHGKGGRPWVFPAALAELVAKGWRRA